MNTDIEKTVKQVISLLQKNKKEHNLIIAIDGPCAAGKTTIANAIKSQIDCNVIRMDDFFLQPQQRTPQRFETPGGNFDKERFLTEVITPLKKGDAFSYRPFDCKKCELSAPIKINPKPITVIEGVYSCHPELWDFYDYHIFIKTDKTTQLKRLENRNPSLLNLFVSKWIPMEEKYFSIFDIENKCDLVIAL